MIQNLHHPHATRERQLLAAFSGMLLILATPPTPLHFLAWFGLVPYFKALEYATSRREAWNLGFIFAVIWHVGTSYWIAWNSGTILIVSIISAIGAILVLSLWYGLLAVFHRWLTVTFGSWAHFLAIILYMASDVVGQSGDWSFPWISFALTQGMSLPILQLASIGGSILITGWVAFLNACLAIGGRRWPSFVLVILLISGTWIWGYLREAEVFEQSNGTQLATVSMIQGNINPEYKYQLGTYYSLNMYDGLSSANVDDETDLIIWPENAAPVYVEQDYRWRRQLQQFADRVDASLITGGRYAEFHDDNSRTPYNAAFLINPQGNQKFNIYKKVYLVPFGERVPFQWILPMLGSLNFGQAEFAAGEDIITWPVPINDDLIRVSPLICYEAIFPQAGWKAAHKQADLLVNMTNDTWFTGTGQQVQHLLLSRMRSIETGRSLARATNTGISAFVSPSGRIMKTLGSDLRGAITHTVETPIDTPYIQGGWRLNSGMLYAAAVLLLVTAVVSLVQRKRQ